MPSRRIGSAPKPRRRPGSLRDLEARLQLVFPQTRPSGAHGECRRGSHSRSRLQRLFAELPADRVEEIRELMMLPGYAELLPANPREVIEFYLRLPEFARAAVRNALREGAIGEPVFGAVHCTQIRRLPWGVATLEKLDFGDALGGIREVPE